jgi:hypothetical protein
VREAIDRGLPAPEDRRRAAADRLLEAPDMPVPDREELRQELEVPRARRGMIVLDTTVLVYAKRSGVSGALPEAHR